MTLPKNVEDFISASAQREGCDYPGPKDELFNMGILDSFGLVDFVCLIEDTCGIHIPDDEVKRSNFVNLETIDRFIKSYETNT